MMLSIHGLVCHPYILFGEICLSLLSVFSLACFVSWVLSFECSLSILELLLLLKFTVTGYRTQVNGFLWQHSADVVPLCSGFHRFRRQVMVIWIIIPLYVFLFWLLNFVLLFLSNLTAIYLDTILLYLCCLGFAKLLISEFMSYIEFGIFWPLSVQICSPASFSLTSRGP